MADLIKAVQSLGYGAERIEEVSRDREAEEKAAGIRSLRGCLAVSICLSVPLLLAMILGLLGLEIKGLAFLHNQYFQLAIAPPIQFIISAPFF